MKLPRHYVVGTRPVKVVSTPEGRVTVLAYDWDSGELCFAPQYLTRVLFPAGDPEVDTVSEERFEQLVRELRERRAHA